MAKNFKRSIAMLLVLNMLSGMIPVQALADGDAPAVQATIVFSSSSSSKEASSSSGSSSSESSSSSSSESSSSSSSESSSSGSSESSSSSSSESSSSSSSESSSSSSSESSSSSSSESSSSSSSESSSSSSSESSSSDSSESSSSSSSESSSSSSSESVNAVSESGDTDNDGSKGTVEVETSAGNKESVEVTEKSETTNNDDGSTTVKTETSADGYVTESGAEVDYKGESEMTTDRDGVTTGKSETEYDVYKDLGNGGYYEAEGGSEYEQWKEFDPTLSDKEVDIPLTDEEGKNTNTVEGDKPEDQYTEGSDLPESETDGTYDYEKVSVIKVGNVTVVTNDVNFDQKVLEQLFDGAGNLIGEKDLDYTVSVTKPTNGENGEGDNGLILWVYKGLETQYPDTENLGEGETATDAVVDAIYRDMKQVEELILGKKFDEAVFDETFETETIKEIEAKLNQYDYVYLGSGNVSQYWAAYLFGDSKEGLLTNDPAIDINGEDFYLHESDKHTYNLTKTGYEEFGYPKGLYSTADMYDLWQKMQDDPDLLAKIKAKGTGSTTLYGLAKAANGRFIANSFDHYYENGEKVELEEGEENIMMNWDIAQQFVLVDAKTGETITTYCADIGTATENSFFYNIENLEDADYYDDEQAAMIRSIAANGYWGTAAGEEGSLQNMKDMLSQATDADGNLMFTAEEIACLNDGMALTATQMAIWTFSNKMSGIQFMNSQYSKGDATADCVVKSNYASTAVEDRTTAAGMAAWEAQQASIALMFRVYDYLINMEPTEITNPNTEDTVITKDNFLSDFDVTVVEKIEDHENNHDDNNDNDAYTTNVSFALVVDPTGKDGEQLVVKVFSDDKEIATGRISGALQEGEVQLFEEDGKYTFYGIEMIEGEQSFNLTLEGIQNLKSGVYLYTSEVQGDTSSQTMVGKAEGSRVVNVSMNISFELDVDDRVVAREHVYRDEHDPIYPPQNPPPPALYRMTRGVGQLEIIDEEVPLAEPPQTGDISMLWFAMVLVSGLGLCVLNLKKREEA